VAWRITFSEDAWREFRALPEGQLEQLHTVLVNSWIPDGPQHDRAALVAGIQVLEAAFAFGVTVRWVDRYVDADEVFILKVKVDDP